jgi:hypothetical protein
MRQICNILNVFGAIGILVAFSYCLYQILWGDEIFPFSTPLIFSIIGLCQNIGVVLSRKAPLYIYCPISLLNITNLVLFAVEFYDPIVLEELWKFNLSITISIVFLGLFSILIELNNFLKRIFQILLFLNLCVTIYLIFINSYDTQLEEIITISTSINFIMIFLAITFKYLVVKNINTDKSQNQTDAEANNSTV